MDSSDTPSHSHLLRSKRTRNTSTPDESVKLPLAKKRRSAIRRDTFEPLTGSSVNELAGQAQSGTDVKERGNVPQPAQSAVRPDSQTRDLTLRGAKKTEKRTERGIGLLTLSANNFYTVSQLPALPEQIRIRPTVPYSCVIFPDNDYILALTHTDALIWSYNASASTPTSRELLTFKLPFPPAIAEDPLPLASFTASSANGEPGIVVVSPKWGKIVYWESLTNASSHVPNQLSTGVQGSIPGMFRGELVEQLVPAEPAGFILSLASGRVAQLTIRDQVGRPGIGVQFMRRSAAPTIRGGIFGSIRSVFGADRRKGTAIVRPGRTARAQRDVIVCSEDAVIEFWTNNLLTGNSLSKTLSVKDQLLSSLQSQIEKDDLQQPVHFKVLDLVLTPSPSHDLIRLSDTNSCSLVILAALSSQARSKYYLLEATIADETTQVRVVHPIRCYDRDLADEHAFRPRICIPPASTTAFVIFEKAILLLSLIKISESPSSQLVAEKSALPLPFQDCIPLQDNTIYRVINFAGEEHESGPSCVLAVQGFGIVRVASHLPNDDEVELEDVVSQLGAKARLEQAVFFGTRQPNPLDLKRSYRKAYEQHEITKAILDTSREIVMSTSKHVSKSAPSITDHLQHRARVLQDLVEYSLKTYPDCLGRTDRIMLLWNAEKIAAAQAIWKIQERIQATYPRKDERNSMTLLNFALSALAENRQRYPNPEKGETDHDVMHEMPEYDYNDPRIVCDYYLEGTEIWTTAFQTAFRFREDNAAAYGLGNETYDQGILKSGYPARLPPAWTSTHEQVMHGHDYLEDVCKFLQEWWDYPATQQNGSAKSKSKKVITMPTNAAGNPYDAPPKSLLEKLADRLPVQADLVNRVVLEENIQQRNMVSASDVSQEQKDRQLKALAAEHQKVTNSTLQVIANFNRDGALKLAEAKGDTDLLVTLNIDHLTALYDTLKAHPEQQEIEKKIEAVQDHVETYFERFGNDWAYSHFSSLLKHSKLGTLIAEGQANGGKKQPYLSHFFDTCAQEQKRVGKVSWINNVVGESKFDAAFHTLETVASTQETDIWSKQVELCLAKLAGLAAQEANAPAINDVKISNINYELEYLRIVASLAYHVNAALYDAVDDEAAVQLAVERFVPKSISSSKKAQQTRKYLSKTLHKLATDNLISLSELVDALTLLKLGPLEVEEVDADVDDITDQEFPYALQAIDLAPFQEASLQQKEVLRKSVWRRLLVRDSWMNVNDTAGKSDKEVKEIMQRTILFRTLLDLYRRAMTDDIEVRIPSLDEILEASAYRDESEQASALEDVKLLKRFVEKARLKEHFAAFVKEAKDEVRKFQDRQGEEQAQNLLADRPVVNGDHA
ncbi:hypothetical protein LTS08_005265 [Lithohypha guttulata]|nr:hypothetical protein LTR51_004898 [Lithohypha guttulata]KAK5100514.1 hypothetical protein LTS08_005265 [Lithohypha guttulata]